jgi:MFS family permease
MHRPALLGLGMAAFGAATTASALAYGALASRYSRTAILYGGQLLCAIGMAVCAMARDEAGLLLGCAVAGLLLGAGHPLQATVMQESTPRERTGQVYTLVGAAGFAAGPLGMLLLGGLAQAAGASVATWTAAAGLAVWAIWAWRRLPLDRPLTIGQIAG